MAAGINVGIGADTREYDRAVRQGMVEPVADAQQALDDYVSAGTDAGQDLTRSFETQQRATTELKSDIDKLNGSIRDGFKGSTRSAGGDVDSFRHRSEEGFSEIKDSARSNAIEVGASFTGGFDQALGGLQGFVAEFLAGFGPAGIIAGVGAAALLGTITAAIQGGQEAAEAQQQAIADLTTEYVEAGGAGKRSFDDVKSSIESMASSDGSDVIITLQKAWQAAKTAGGDYSQVVQAIATSDPVQIRRAQAAVDELGKAHERTNRTALGIRAAIPVNARAAAAVDELRGALNKAEHQADSAAKAQKLAAAAGLSQFALKAGEVSQLEQAFDEAAGGVDKYLKHEGKVLDVEPYLKSMKQREKSLEHYHDNLAKADLSPAAVKFLEGQGADTAAAMLRGYERATPAQQAQLGKIWTTAGNENATTYQDAVGKKLAGTPISAPKIERPEVPLADTARLDAQLSQPRYMRVVVDYFDRKGQRVY
jgi:hypothetical protein